MKTNQDLLREKIINAANNVGKITAEKNLAYGNSFAQSGKVLEILFPDGVKPEQYQDILLVARILDKLFRIANDKGAFNEDPFLDLAGYGILGAVSNLSKKELETSEFWSNSKTDNIDKK